MALAAATASPTHLRAVPDIERWLNRTLDMLLHFGLALPRTQDRRSTNECSAENPWTKARHTEADRASVSEADADGS